MYMGNTDLTVIGPLIVQAKAKMERCRIEAWHVHSNQLKYLTKMQSPVEIL